MANFDAYKLDDARAAGVTDDQIVDTLHQRYGDFYNAKAARAAGVSVDAMLPIIEQRRSLRASAAPPPSAPPSTPPQPAPVAQAVGKPLLPGATTPAGAVAQSAGELISSPVALAAAAPAAAIKGVKAFPGELTGGLEEAAGAAGELGSQLQVKGAPPVASPEEAQRRAEAEVGKEQKGGVWQYLKSKAEPLKNALGIAGGLYRATGIPKTTEELGKGGTENINNVFGEPQVPGSPGWNALARGTGDVLVPTAAEGIPALVAPMTPLGLAQDVAKGGGLAVRAAEAAAPGVARGAESAIRGLSDLYEMGPAGQLELGELEKAANNPTQALPPAPVAPPAPAAAPGEAKRLADLVEAQKGAQGLPGAVEQPGALAPAQQAVQNATGITPAAPRLPVPPAVQATAGGWEKKQPQSLNDFLDMASQEEPPHEQPPASQEMAPRDTSPEAFMQQVKKNLPTIMPTGIRAANPEELARLRALANPPAEEVAALTPAEPTPAKDLPAPPASFIRTAPAETHVNAEVSGAKVGQVVPVNPAAIHVDPERFQYKMDTNAAGIQKELPGEWDPHKAGNLILWQDEAGKVWAVNGHHRLDKAVKSGAPFVNSMILKASDGWTDKNAMVLGAELNIAEGRGTIYDGAKFFRLSKEAGNNYSDGELKRKGLFDAPAQRIGTRASPDLYASFNAGRITPAQADAIVRVSSDPGEQAVGLREATQNPKADASDIANLMAAQRAHNIEAAGAQQGEMFGHDDAALNHAREMSRAASAMQRDLGKDINAAQGAVKNPEAAAKSGINIADQAAAVSRLEQLKALRARLDPTRWYNDPEVVDMIKAKAFGIPEKEEVAPLALPDDRTVDMFGQDQAGSTNLLGAVADTLEAADAKIHTRSPGNMSDSMQVIPEKMKQVWAQLGITGEVSRASPILRFLGRPEDVAPAVQRDASRVNDVMYQSMSKYGETIDKVSRVIGRRMLRPDEYKPEWLEWKRQNQGLNTMDEGGKKLPKMFMTASDLVAMGLDGKIPVAELPKDIAQAVAVNRQVLDAVAGLEGFKGTQLYIPDYYPHIFDNPATLRRLQAAAGKEGGVDLSPWGPIASDPFLKERLGLSGYSLDWDKAVRARVWQAHKKVYLEPLAVRIDEYRNKLPDTPAGNAANIYLEHYRNDLLGRPGNAERTTDEIARWVADMINKGTGGHYFSAMEKLDASYAVRRLQEAGIIRKVPSSYLIPGGGWSRDLSAQVADSIFFHLIGFAISTPIKHVFQGINVAAKTSLEAPFVGYAKLAPTLFSKEGRAFLKNDVLRDMLGIWDGYNASVGNRFFDAWKKIGRAPMQLAMTVQRGAAYHAGLYEGAKLAEKGLIPNTKEALHEYALGIVDQSYFKYGITNTNPYFQNPYGRVLRILTSYPQAQTMFLARLAQNKSGEKIAGIPAGFLRYLILSGAVAGAALGMGYDVSSMIGAENITVGKKKGFQAKNNPGTTIPVPLLGAPAEFAGVISDHGPPGIKAAQGLQAIAGGDLKTAKQKLAEVAQMVILGKMGIPKEALKLADMINEWETGHALKGRKPFLTAGIDQQRAKAYNITPGESTAKYLGFRPQVQRAYLDAMAEKAARMGRH